MPGQSPDRHHRLFAVAAPLLSVLLAAAPAAADTVSFNQQGRCSQWTVPAGVSTVAIEAIGAAGSDGVAKGGKGGKVGGTAAFTHGQTLSVCVAVGGGAGGSSGGGQGGGGSGVSLGANFSSPVVIAGGGGGGGAGSVPGAGGAAGASGTSGGGSAGSVGGGSQSNAGGPGTGAAGSGTGGGGGGGSVGGGGGSGGSLGGGGGAGGTNLCSVSSCTTTTSTDPPEVALTYTVASPPTTAISLPADGGVYALNASVTSSFGCTEGTNGPGIASCFDQDHRPSGAPIDTSTPGAHRFTATAISGDGLSSSSSVTYTVAAPPLIWLPLPSNGAVFTLGQVVRSYYLCADGSGGPGLKSCVDQNGRPAGAALDTSTLGPHNFMVTATSQDGQATSTRVTYQVEAGPTVSGLRALRGGVITLRVAVFGPGTIDAMTTASFRSFALAADAAGAIQPPLGTFVFGSAHAASTRTQTVSLRVRLSQAGRLLLRDHRRASIHLWVLYTTPGGTQQLIKSQTFAITR